MPVSCVVLEAPASESTDHGSYSSQAEYDKLDPQIRTKELYYTEATVHLNRANEAHQAAGGAEEPTALTFGKSASGHCF